MCSVSPSCSSTPSGYVEVDTNGHCFICLKNLQGESDTVGKSNSKDINLLTSSVLRYLTGSSHHQYEEDEKGTITGGGSGGRDVFEGVLKMIKHFVPPLCEDCHDKLATLQGYHEELVQIQMKIQEQTERVRKCVAGTKQKRSNSIDADAEGYSQRDKYVASLGNSSNKDTDANFLVLLIHEEIISKGTDPVKFPTRVSLMDEKDGQAEENVKGNDDDYQMDLTEDDKEGVGDDDDGSEESETTSTCSTSKIDVITPIAMASSRFARISDPNLISDQDLLDNETWKEMLRTDTLKPVISRLRTRRKRLQTEVRKQLDPTFIPTYKVNKNRRRRERLRALKNSQKALEGGIKKETV